MRNSRISNRRKFTLKTRTLVVFFLALLFIGPANAQEQSDFEFDKGSILIRCEAPEGSKQISTKLFNTLFPIWITSLQGWANDGLVSRAHYLGELKQGMLIVVTGKNREDTKANATYVLGELISSMESAVEESGTQLSFEPSGACHLSEIGPVAILPGK